MRERISPSLVISIIALIVALGGASYAAVNIPKNSVGSKQLKKNAVTSKKLKKNAVTAKKLKKNAVNSAKLKRGSVTSDKLRDGAVNSAKVEDGSLLRSDFEPGQLAGEAWYAPREPPVPLLVVTNDFAPVVTTETLPAGSYVLAARANVLGGGGVTSRLICSMLNDAAQLFEVVSGNVFPLSMSATAVLDEPATVSLNCLKNAGSPQIAQAHIIATQVPKINESTSPD